ncbi:hypothetical protein EMIHUDRAFT_96820 [Emiliania huxleyi CCMP1516]|uniref:VTT domain-containing protein n=2 Tax=Emiliania huxleyi TaxID=2903 RepID=A0A0D3IE87_EMIH1|nr:hypothetical protein EMIHUDRAFT_96820 [Emiliania huxleyi CCMP1516]EOD09572.1 hypothetical protein EMIHUDRAFT_96820 [Emiliania huxleyi CCMP1516]|eukprot:XP_005762001.1 hypothetical protein EMIHUDRAFT_96820 [Emiliania huxleyi CCMP1516]
MEEEGAVGESEEEEEGAVVDVGVSDSEEELEVLQQPNLIQKVADVVRLSTDQRESRARLGDARAAAADGSNDSSSGGDGAEAPSAVVAGSALAASAVIFEGVQVAGTTLLFLLAQRWTGAQSPVEVVTLLVDYLRDLGDTGYAAFAAMMVTFQVIPVAAAFVLTVSAGAIFGATKGTALVLSCSTISATISFLLARLFGRSLVLDAARESPTFQAIDAAFANVGFAKAFTLIFLLRLSPILPFSWANYVFGLSPVPWAAFSLGTLTGCLPAVAAYVTSGELGASIAVDGGDTNPWLLAVGIAATISAISVAGNIASDALREEGLDFDLEGESKARS